MLYDLLFKPVVVLLKHLYLAIFSCTGDWGASLVLLAVVMNVLLRPLGCRKGNESCRIFWLHRFVRSSGNCTVRSSMPS